MRNIDGTQPRFERGRGPAAHLVVAAKELGGITVGDDVLIPGAGYVATVGELAAAQALLLAQNEQSSTES